MTATQIIDEIESLQPAQQAEVIRYALKLETTRKLAGAELSNLAARLSASTDPLEAASLRAELERGFYGKAANA